MNTGDDLEFNIKFVKLIEQYKVLYDHSIEGNSNRQTHEKAWREIALELDENWMSCKEKWKNIRSCYTRHLRQKAGDKTKKPYYLSKHLHFLLPFCKSLTLTSTLPPFSSPSQALLWSKIEVAEDEPQEDPLTFENKEEEFEGDHIYFISAAEEPEKESKNEDTNNKSDKETEETCTQPTSTSSNRRRNRRKKLLFPREKREFPYPPIKKGFNVDCEDPDLNFLKSLLPDMRRMTNKQKYRLKIKILNEIEGTLYPDDS